MHTQEYYSIPQLAKMLGISRIAIYKKVKAGQIEATRIGRSFAISGEYIHNNIVRLKELLLSPEEVNTIDLTVKRMIADYPELFKKLGKY